MKFLFALGLFCRFILASHLKNNENDFNEDKSSIEKLPIGPLNEIIHTLDKSDQERLSKTSKEFFKYDPREVVLNLPLQSKKEPSQFICEHLKLRKRLMINFKNGKYEYRLFKDKSLEMKYLNCLSGIEELRFGRFIMKSKLLVGSKFNLDALFPNLRYLGIHLDNDFASSHSIKFPEFVPPLLSGIIKLKNFERLSIVFSGHSKTILDILAHTKNANYFLDLSLDLDNYLNVGDFLQLLPKKTEEISLSLQYLDDPKSICKILPSLTHLKKLTFRPEETEGKFDCILESLPPSLIEFSFDGAFKIYDTRRIILPKHLHTVFLLKVNAVLFELLANHVEVLTTTISDSDNIINIKEPFTKVKKLVFLSNIYSPMEEKALLHLFNLLPMKMDFLDIWPVIQNYEFQIIDKKILSMQNQIKEIRLKSVIAEFGKREKRKYVFDGMKMIRAD